VLVNLVTNARQAIRELGSPGVIAVRTGRTPDGRVLLEVRDSGPGIPEEIRSRIFDPFFTTRTAGSGTGLGLWLVYGIVAAHGGTVEVLTAAEGGAAFRIALGVETDLARAELEGAAVPDRRPARAARILVVDDEEPLARLICEALSEEGHRTEAVFDGPSALARATEGTFDLIISDLRMPGMDGDQFGRELERVAPALARRLLLTTGDTLSDLPPALSARDLLRKPFDLDELRRVVRARLLSAEA
jgi:CheY-like chemotaxis protein